MLDTLLLFTSSMTLTILQFYREHPEIVQRLQQPWKSIALTASRDRSILDVSALSE